MEFISLEEMGYKYNTKLNYEDNILSFLVLLPKGRKIKLRSIAKDPKVLIEAVKKLIDDGWLRNGEYFFSNDYELLQRQS